MESVRALFLRIAKKPLTSGKALFEKLDPSRFTAFRSPLHHERTAAVLGISLGASFFICFATGMVSHIMQHPPSWYDWPTHPAGFYRFTQGLHVATGLLAIPLLFAKLWVIFPKLFEWPPVANVAHFLERLSLLPLIGGGLFLLISGVANINQWYFFPFFFPTAHYAMAWVAIGGLVIHIGAKWTITRTQLRRPTTDSSTVEDRITRRNFLLGVFGIGGIVTFFTVGQTVTPLGRLALLAPRQPGIGPQNFPVNRSAVAAGVIEKANAAEFVLSVEGAVNKPLSLSLQQLRQLPQHSAELPIACVEGWSQSARWTGVRVRDLMAMADATGKTVLVNSIEQGSPYASSVLNRHHSQDEDTLLALELNGEQLHIDHGYPCRLIGPNRPGVLQTKWVKNLVVQP